MSHILTPVGARPSGRGSPGRDEGSILLLTIFYGFLALVLVLTVVAATSLYLEHKRLLTLADGAALAGAEAFPLASVRAGGPGGSADAGARGDDGSVRPVLTGADVASGVSGYLTAVPHEEFENLEVTRATSLDGQSATVSLSASWRPPVLTLVVPAGIPLTVTSVARSVFW